jgi:hypothetical protein
MASGFGITGATGRYVDVPLSLNLATHCTMLHWNRKSGLEEGTEHVIQCHNLQVFRTLDGLLRGILFSGKISLRPLSQFAYTNLIPKLC